MTKVHMLFLLDCHDLVLTCPLTIWTQFNKHNFMSAVMMNQDWFLSQTHWHGMIRNLMIPMLFTCSYCMSDLLHIYCLYDSTFYGWMCFFGCLLVFCMFFFNIHNITYCFTMGSQELYLSVLLCVVPALTLKGGNTFSPTTSH